MTVLSKDSELKRAQFTQEILDDIRNAPGYCSFYLYVSTTMAALGLQCKAKEAKLFENEDWSNLANKERLMKKIEQFLNEYT
ncbi:hypothetical protein LCGC14_1181930 [marine sediment metagenome]|uniref:Uncharacterized protein n=1 Tax=marine sediment metagenome TaxID=412755 RepID=A0A0F9P4R5_9ZZZZ